MAQNDPFWNERHSPTRGHLAPDRLFRSFGELGLRHRKDFLLFHCNMGPIQIGE